MPFSHRKYGWALRYVPEFSGLLLIFVFLSTAWLVSQARSQTEWLVHEAGKGTGLGLSQVHGFLKQSSGHIKIYSEVGTGTTVKMYFPRQTRSDKAAEIPVSALPRGTDAEVILIVEDDQRVRELTVAMVRELGYTGRSRRWRGGGSETSRRAIRYRTFVH